MKSKSDPRHSARKLALTNLFCTSFSPTSTAEECLLLSTELLNLEIDQNLYNSITNGVTTHLEQLDQVITKCAPEWPVDKIAKIDLCILRISIYEIMHCEDTPTKVAIDEAVELGKEFGNETTSKFVNGVLGTVVNLYREQKAKEEALNKASESEKASE